MTTYWHIILGKDRIRKKDKDRSHFTVNHYFQDFIKLQLALAVIVPGISTQVIQSSRPLSYHLISSGVILESS